MSLLRDIQESAVGTDTPVTVLLRQCLVLASRLNHQPLRDWAKLELDGYPSEVPLPPYRQRFQTQVIAHLSGGFGAQMSNVGLSPAGVPDEEMRELLFSAETRQGVAALEQLLATGDGLFQRPWPMDVVGALQNNFWEGYSVVEAHRVIPATQIAASLSGIRDRVVEFALDIEALDADAGEAEPGEAPIPRDQITQVFNNTIYGGQNVITAAAGDAEVKLSQTSISTVWPELAERLTKLGVPAPDLADLQTALINDGDPETELGSEAQAWLGRMSTKIASGALALGEAATAETIAHELLRAFGLS